MGKSFRDTLEGEGTSRAGWELCAFLWYDVILGRQRAVRHWLAQLTCLSFYHEYNCI